MIISTMFIIIGLWIVHIDMRLKALERGEWND